MSGYVTHEELDTAKREWHEAIARVENDLKETEYRLRVEFTGAIRHEVGRLDDHLDKQDTSMKWQTRWLIGVLTTLIVSLLTGIIIYWRH